MDSDTARGTPAGERRPGGRTLAVGVLLLLLLVLVALASGARGRGTIAPAPRAVPGALFDYLFTLGIVLVLAGAAALLLLRAPFKAPAHDPTGFLRLALFMAFLAAFAYVAVRGGFGRVQGLDLQELLERREEAAARGQGEETGPGEPLRFRWELVVVLGALSAAFAALHLLRRRRRPPLPRALEERLAELLEDTLDDLRSEADARRAVIAAYARMERTLGAHGRPRRPSEAPFEFLGRALRDLEVSAEAAVDLTALFEQAKFSLHAIDGAMKEEAISALATVRDDLRAAA